MKPAAGCLSNVGVITVGASAAAMVVGPDKGLVQTPGIFLVLYTPEWRGGALEGVTNYSRGVITSSNLVEG